MTVMNEWLKRKLDIFELRVRASKSDLAHSVGHDTYWCAGWAQGYMAAQRDARRSARETGEPK